MGVVRRVGSPYWWLTLPRRGRRPIRETTKLPVDGGTAQQTEENRQLARTLYALRMAELAREDAGLPASPSRTGQPTGPTFATFSDWYLAHIISQHRGQTREQEILAVLRATFTTWPLTAITRASVHEWMTARRAVVSAQTVNREVDLLKALLREAATQGFLPVSPLVGMKRLHITRRPKVRLSPEDERRLLAALKSPSDRAMLVMGLDTLARMGDILDFRRDHDHGRTLTIADPKNAMLIEVPVSRRLRKALNAVKKRGPFYFWHRRRAKNPRDWRSAVRQMLEAACRRADIPYGRAANAITWHAATRRTGASRMLARGIPMPVVMDIGGWKTLEQVKDYWVPDDADRRAAVEAVGRRRAK